MSETWVCARCDGCELGCAGKLLARGAELEQESAKLRDEYKKLLLDEAALREENRKLRAKLAEVGFGWLEAIDGRAK